MRSAAAEGGRLEQWVSPMLTDRERVAIFHLFRVLRMPSRRPAHINPTPKTVPAHLACSPDNQTTAASRMFGSADFADCPPLGSSPLPALQAATSIRPKKNSGGPILLWLTLELSRAEGVGLNDWLALNRGAAGARQPLAWRVLAYGLETRCRSETPRETADE